MMSELYQDRYAAKRYLKQYDRAIDKGMDFDLTLSEFSKIVARKKCFYTGVTMIKLMGENSLDGNVLTLDRIDNSKGYVKGNVVACTKSANNLKAIWENPEFKLTVENARDVALKTIAMLKLDNKE